MLSFLAALAGGSALVAASIILRFAATLWNPDPADVWLSPRELVLARAGMLALCLLILGGLGICFGLAFRVLVGA